jgi:hypothetical protein
MRPVREETQRSPTTSFEPRIRRQFVSFVMVSEDEEEEEAASDEVVSLERGDLVRREGAGDGGKVVGMLAVMIASYYLYISVVVRCSQ